MHFSPAAAGRWFRRQAKAEGAIQSGLLAGPPYLRLRFASAQVPSPLRGDRLATRRNTLSITEVESIVKEFTRLLRGWVVMGQPWLPGSGCPVPGIFDQLPYPRPYGPAVHSPFQGDYFDSLLATRNSRR